jgi:hypothetical protein
MIKFFRTIRQTLLTESKFSKYMLYAIGEIVLVVIGILIALSINNWNNERQNELKGTVYLEGIRNDLVHDTEFIKTLMPRYQDRYRDFRSLDSLVRIGSDSIFDIDYQKIRRFSYQTYTFYPRIGSYASLVSENSTALISNDSLSKRLKNIYDIQYVRIGTLGQELDDIATRINWERRQDYRHELKGFDHQDYNALFADLGEMHRNVGKYRIRMKKLLVILEECIDAIDKELENEPNP